jgi:hypothetical protein
MTKKYENIKLENLYKDALLSLGVENKDINNLYEKYFKQNSEIKLSAFIRNNVINSNRFKYIVKYINPSQINKITSNPKIVKYVLEQIPETQIDRYYKVIKDDNEPCLAGNTKKIELITTHITGTKFDKFIDESLANIDKNNHQRKIDIETRERKKALLSLYYTIVYIFVKNMVQINALYIIGFFYLERDKFFFGPKLKKNFKPKENYDALTRLFTIANDSDVKKLKVKDREKLEKYIYIDNKDNHASKHYDALYNEYRNSIDHLNIVSNMTKYIDNAEFSSYFGIFHLAAQKTIYKNINAKNAKNYMDSIVQEETENKTCNEINQYSKTLLLAMNIPFGYTLARYKNLSYERLFYHIYNSKENDSDKGENS